MEPGEITSLSKAWTWINWYRAWEPSRLSFAQDTGFTPSGILAFGQDLHRSLPYATTFAVNVIAYRG